MDRNGEIGSQPEPTASLLGERPSVLRASAIAGAIALHAALLLAVTLPVSPFERLPVKADDVVYISPLRFEGPGCHLPPWNGRKSYPDATAIGRHVRVSVQPAPGIALSVPSVLDGLDLGTGEVGRARFDAPVQALVSPAPEYPLRALHARQSGSVEIEVVVSADGTPVSARIVRSSGHRALDEAALATVLSGWRFQPQVRDGEAVEAVATVPVEFVLPADVARG